MLTIIIIMDNGVIENQDKKKRKVGRPRKNKIENNDNNTIPKKGKKRGRKPKIKTEEDLKPKIPKKRGRKPKERVYNIDLINNSKSKSIEQNNIILHLPFNSNIIYKNDNILSDNTLKYNPELKEPMPYVPNNQLQSDYAIISDKLKEQIKNLNENESINDILSDEEDNEKENNNSDNAYNDYDSNKSINKQENIQDLNYQDNLNNNEIDSSNNILLSKTGVETFNKNTIKAIKEIKIHELMHDFISNINNEWITETNISCYWCCHSFRTIPIGIPFKYIKNIFYLWGCFCSFNCAASYIFNEHKQEKWERYSLLHLLYTKITNDECSKIKLAPSRQLLKMFGGNMNIVEFRNSSLILNTNYNIITIPLISIIPQLEEVKYNVLNKNLNIENNKNDNKIYDKTKLRLYRDKPLSNKNNTLETYMSLKIL